MREIPTSILNKLNQTHGSEPIIIVGIKWDGENEIFYSDKKRSDEIGAILDLPTLETVATIDGNTDSTSINITLDDSGNELKKIYDTNNIVGKEVSVYQTFEGIEDRLLLFEGIIATPIEWSEGNRTLSFTVINQIFSKEVGFSAEEAVVPYLAEGLINSPWPVCFGRPIYVPALKLQATPTGMTAESFGFADLTIQLQINKLGLALGNLSKALTLAFFYQAIAHFQGDDDLSEQWRQQTIAIQEEINRIKKEITDLTLTLSQQAAYEKPIVKIIGGYRFPKGKHLTCKIGEQVCDVVFLRNNGSATTTNQIDIAWPALVKRGSWPTGPTEPDQEVIKQGFTWIPAGSQVVIISDFPINHVVSVIPGSVDAVHALRNHNGLKTLVQVPNNYYTVGELAGAVTIVLNQPLSAITHVHKLEMTSVKAYLQSIGAKPVSGPEGVKPHLLDAHSWEDDLYVTFTSSVGPNVVDILIYLIETYTNLTYDEESFDAVRDKLVKYPANFALLDRKNVFDLMKDIAYQSRCAIFIKTGIVYIKYLSLPEEPVRDITYTDIDLGSLIITSNDSDNLITKYVATWRKDYYHKEPHQIVLRHNVNKYGSIDEEYDYYIYNDFSLVEKSAIYWMIKNCNIWKIIKCSLHLNCLGLETFDTVNLSFLDPLVADEDVVGVIQSIKYDSSQKLLEAEIWTPVRLGEMVPYIFAFPSNVETIFPTEGEIQAGSAGQQAPKFLTLPEPLPGVTVNFNPTRSDPFGVLRPFDQYPFTYGRRNLSDSSDTTPQPVEYSIQEIEDDATPIFDYNYNPLRDIGDVKKRYSLCYPGLITSSAGGNKYNVQAYKQGKGKPPTAIVVEQLQLAAGKPIPPNTWTLIVENEDDDQNRTYAMQVPVWLPKP